VLAALRGVRAGNFGVRLPLDWTGVPGTIADVFNDVVEANQRLSRELTSLTDMATDRDRVLNAVARGDLSQRVALDVDGRPLEGAFLRSGQVVNIKPPRLGGIRRNPGQWWVLVAVPACTDRIERLAAL